MSKSRAKILQAIKDVGLEEKALPDVPNWQWSKDYADSFTQVLATLSTTCLRVRSKEEALAHFKEKLEDGALYYNGLSDEAQIPARPHEWDQLDAVLLEGKIGVAENGAIWVPESAMVDRVIPFICKHLYLLIGEKDLLGTMHEAYRYIQDKDYGFGVFISGPSKTADIEQALVIGAHGPLALTVMLLAEA